jgi:transposase
MGRERYVVRLEGEERDHLEHLIRGGKSPARKVARARILLKADASWGVGRIVEALDISAGTVCRTKRRYLEGGLSRALEEDPRPGQPAKLDERGEAHLIALVCSEAPQGHDHWTLRLLANKVVELGIVPSMSHEGIRKRLKKTVSSRGRRRSGVYPR